MPNTLFYGDNLHVMREHLDDASVDLVYLDTPFNSNRDYNVLFKEQSGADSPAQIKAFEVVATLPPMSVALLRLSAARRGGRRRRGGLCYNHWSQCLP